MCVNEMTMNRDGAQRLEIVQDQASATRGKNSMVNDAYERIKEDIFELRMPPGQRYSEQEFANALGISRTPLRLALHLLAYEGYLQRLDGHSSWQVKPFDLAHYDDLYDFRTSIEVIAVRRLCAMDSPPDLSALCRFWMVPEAERNLDGKRVAQEDERFHQALVELAGNREMARTSARLTERIRIIRRLDFTDAARISAAFDEHRAILRCLMTRKADRAEMLVKAHIGASRIAIRHITLHRLALAAVQPDAR